jgi:nucleotide-binding universal stress UspA family protein
MDHGLKRRRALKHILCPVDGSEPSLRAVAVAAEIAKATSAKLTLLMVRDYMITRGGITENWTEEEAKAALAKSRQAALEAASIAPEVVDTRARDPAMTILDFAERKGIDHIVIGSAGKGAVRKLLIGSTSSDVLRKSHCPVTIVH